MNKIEAMALKGGCCQLCGCEFTDLRKAHFHHLASAGKKFNISDGLNGRKNTKDLKKELNKTILLCDTCHSAVHKALGKKCLKRESLSYINENKTL